MSTFLRLSSCLLAAALSSPVTAQTAVKVESAWARATVQGQQATGAFMKLTAPQATRLVAVSTPAAGVAEIHEMKMDGGVMKMRAMPVLDLPANQAVELKPGSYHLMLMDLKTPLMKDSSLALTLTFKDAKGVESKQQINVPVSSAAPAQPGHSDHKH
ncbi:copper chaperone PCu(A)C [Limnohabitans sp. Jir72]|uniref:copper chaperone PCu(A)C n=1 Tax=Limnohabitans sp. Jir72 TaxID=1977909 RepID=UPI000D374FEC|nr:copper chaperone PCu(A)C [Limnohabitans sp. Jir72]